MTGAASGAERWGVVVHHPSRRAEVRETYARLAARLARERPGYVLWCLDTPTAPVVEHARRAPAGATFAVVPLLLAPGKHFAEDVGHLADAVAAAAPGLTVTVRPPLLEDDAFLEPWLERL